MLVLSVADAYLINQAIGKHFHLPIAAKWEYAAKADKSQKHIFLGFMENQVGNILDTDTMENTEFESV